MRTGSVLEHVAVGVAILILALCRTGPLSAQGSTDTAAQGSPETTLHLLSSREPPPAIDVNGFLLRPRWLGAGLGNGVPDIGRLCRFRVPTGELAERFMLVTKGPCLSAYEDSVVTLNEATSTVLLGLACNTNSAMGHVRGHVNWFPVTVTGRLTWDEFEGEEPHDNDVNVNLAAPEPNALTTGNPQIDGKPVYHLEFNFRETLGRLKRGSWDQARKWESEYAGALRELSGDSSDGAQSWWVALRDSLAHRDAMRRLVNSRVANVTGVYGLDGVHEFQAEIHPVFSMAVLIDTVVRAGHAHEQWAVMVRDRGNEGECSLGRMRLQLAGGSVQTFLVDLGPWSGIDTAAVYLGRAWSTDTLRVPVVWRDTVGGHLVVGFRHPRPATGKPDYLFFGTLDVQWTGAGSGRRTKILRDWLAPDTTHVNVDSLAWPSESARVNGKPAFVGGSKPGRTGGRPEPSLLKPMAPRTLVVSDTALPPATLLAERTTPWIDPAPVLPGCVGTSKLDYMCRSPFEIGLGWTSGGDLTFPVVSAYWYTRTVHFRPWFLRWLNPVLDVLAPRLDISPDRFRRSCRATSCTAQSLPGWSARIGLELSPLAIPIGPFLATPHNIVAVGWSNLLGLDGAPLLGVGLGTRVKYLPWPLTALLEAQNDLRTGGFESHWSFNVGVLLQLQSVLGWKGS